ncbi:beta-1,3-galactosyltransferase 5 [Dendroctonus ponderosae]|nr:beta-1,3-galactosyltransferase 5 [Dendroctonus ponderosae]
MRLFPKFLLSFSLLALVFLLIHYLTKSPTIQSNLALISTNHLLNIPFRYWINNEKVCIEGGILGVFIVTSYFGNVETRSSMRRAFGGDALKKLGLRRVFLLGHAPGDKYTTQHALEEENRRFGDIVQGTFMEAYRNLTYKHVMGLKWAGTYCPNAQFVIKMDDDTVLNMYRLNLLLASLKAFAEKSFIAGYKLDKMKPIRDTQNKWYVTQEEYAAKIYPQFVSGWFYITTPQVSGRLASRANQEKFFWIDDVFITGLLAKKLKVKLFDISQYFAVNSEYLQCCLQDFKRQLDCDFYVGPNGGYIDMFYQFNHNYFTHCVEHKCKRKHSLPNESCVAEKKINLGRGAPLIETYHL